MREGWLSRHRATMQSCRVEEQPHQRGLGRQPPLVRVLLDEIGDRLDRAVELFIQHAVEARRRIDPRRPNGDPAVRASRTTTCGDTGTDPASRCAAAIVGAAHRTATSVDPSCRRTRRESAAAPFPLRELASRKSERQRDFRRRWRRVGRRPVTRPTTSHPSSGLSAFGGFVDAGRTAANRRADERALLTPERAADAGAGRRRARDHQRGLRLRPPMPAFVVGRAPSHGPIAVVAIRPRVGSAPIPVIDEAARSDAAGNGLCSAVGMSLRHHCPLSGRALHDHRRAIVVPVAIALSRTDRGYAERPQQPRGSQPASSCAFRP